MVSSEMWRYHKHTWIAMMLAVVTGYADVISLVRYQAFASILTGNVVWLARVLVSYGPEDKHSCWYYLAIVCSLGFGAFLHRLCELIRPNRGGSIASVPLAVFMLSAEVLYLITDCYFNAAEIIQCESAYLQRWTVVGIAPMFGVVASACSTGRLGAHTTMVTGHILKLVGALAKMLFGKELAMKEKANMCMSVMVIAGTVAGACLGAWAVQKFDYHLLLFPVPVLLTVLLWLHDHLAKPRTLIKKVQDKWRHHSEQASSTSEARDDFDCAASACSASESESEDDGKA